MRARRSAIAAAPSKVVENVEE